MTIMRVTMLIIINIIIIVNNSGGKDPPPSREHHRHIYITFTFNHLADSFYPKRFTNEDKRTRIHKCCDKDWLVKCSTRRRLYNKFK